MNRNVIGVLSIVVVGFVVIVGDELSRSGGNVLNGSSLSSRMTAFE